MSKGRLSIYTPFRLRSALEGFSPLNELSFFDKTNALNSQSPSTLPSVAGQAQSKRVCTKNQHIDCIQ